MTIAMMAPALDSIRIDTARNGTMRDGTMLDGTMLDGMGGDDMAGPASGSGPGPDSGGDFFAVAAQRLDWIDQRQRVLAGNIANANTPNYRPRDLSPFEQVLQAGTAAPARTDPHHLGGAVQSASLVVQVTSGRAPDGNRVSLENQLTKVADDETASALVNNLWKTTMGMYLTALGHGS